jgi:hypothetical protein
MLKRCGLLVFVLAMWALVGCDHARETFGDPTPLPAAPVARADEPAERTPPAATHRKVEKVEAPKSDTPAEPEQSAKAPALAPIELSGKGDQVSDKFSVEAGLSTWQVSHDGRSNFQVSLLNDEGREIDMAINEIGAFKGTLVVRVPKAGAHVLSVKADGKWAVTIRQPRPQEGTAKPLSKQGSGPDVATFVTLPKGLNVFQATHSGDGVFRVTLFDRDGRLVEHVFARIGHYDGSKAVTLDKEGIYAVGVYANGGWSLKIR